MNETEYQPHLAAALSRAGRQSRVWRQNAGAPPRRNRRGKIVGAIHGAPKGAADLSGLVRPEGWRLEVEVKSPTRVVTDEQRSWRAFIESSGGIYVVCRYDPKLSLEDNLRQHVALVDEAISDRRQSTTTRSDVSATVRQEAQELSHA